MKGAKRVNFKDIVKLETLSDDEHIVLVYLASRVMRLSLKDSLPFLLAVQRNMKVSSHKCFFSPFKRHFFSCRLKTLRLTPGDLFHSGNPLFCVLMLILGVLAVQFKIGY